MNRLYRLHARRKAEGKAFTLLELIVVLLVLGVLAAIAVPTYDTLKTNSVDRSVNTTLDAIARAGEAAYISDPQMTDEQVAAASLDGLTADDDAGTPGYQQGDRTISRDDNEVTVSLSSGTIDRSGTVSFADGISSVNYAGAAPGGGGGGSLVLVNLSDFWFYQMGFMGGDAQSSWSAEYPILFRFMAGPSAAGYGFISQNYYDNNINVDTWTLNGDGTVTVRWGGGVSEGHVAKYSSDPTLAPGANVVPLTIP